MKRAASLFLVSVFLTACADPAPAAAVPVIYCTDLFHPHDDPDDHFDLAVLFAIPELDVKAIILDQGEKQKQRPGAIPVSQMNSISGRTVPAVAGLAHPLKHPADKALDQPAEFQGGVALILRTLRESPVPVMVAAVGSMRDLAAAFNREPELCRKKMGRLLVFIGEASDPGFREYNVGLDPQAFVGLMRSGLPAWWVPCFDGGLWQNRGHASFWKAAHRDLLRTAAPEVVQFFIYALEKEKSEGVAFLSQPVEPPRKEKLFAGQRNLWCTVIFEALAWPAGKTANDVFQFTPIDVAISNDGAVRYDSEDGSRRVMRFEVRDPATYAANMTEATAEALGRLPRGR